MKNINIKPNLIFNNERKRKSIIITLIVFIASSLSIFLYINYVNLSEKNNTSIYSAFILHSVDNPISQPTKSGVMQNVTWLPYLNKPIITPGLDSESAGSNGNIYAPEIIYENGIYKMYYGGQGSDGHDRIHYAVSSDCIHWQKLGVVVDIINKNDSNNPYNHVNDPSVVKVNGTYYMFYTTAITHENDVISLATSQNGINWSIIGNVFLPGALGNWDSFKVGRPSVLYENGTFKMWYDGTEADPNNPEQIKPGTGRHVGYAESSDGIHWSRFKNNPIFFNGGAVDVEYIGGKYILLQESGDGTIWGYANNETDFIIKGFLFNKTGKDWDKYGHVTPHILNINDTWVATSVGVCTDKCWCQNRIGIWFPFSKIRFSPNQLSGNNENNENELNYNMQDSLIDEAYAIDKDSIVAIIYDKERLEGPLDEILNAKSDENGEFYFNIKISITINQDSSYQFNAGMFKNKNFPNNDLLGCIIWSNNDFREACTSNPQARYTISADTYCDLFKNSYYFDKQNGELIKLYYPKL